MIAYIRSSFYKFKLTINKNDIVADYTDGVFYRLCLIINKNDGIFQ